MPEKVSESTWRRMYQPFMARLLTVAGERQWRDEVELLSAVLRQWEPNSRARQMAHDRFRQLWGQAGWERPAEVAGMRGNGKAAADPAGAHQPSSCLRSQVHCFAVRQSFPGPP